MAKNGVAQCWLEDSPRHSDGDGLEIWIGQSHTALACCSDAQQLFVVLLGGQILG